MYKSSILHSISNCTAAELEIEHKGLSFSFMKIEHKGLDFVLGKTTTLNLISVQPKLNLHGFFSCSSFPFLSKCRPKPQKPTTKICKRPQSVWCKQRHQTSQRVAPTPA